MSEKMSPTDKQIVANNLTQKGYQTIASSGGFWLNGCSFILNEPGNKFPPRLVFTDKKRGNMYFPFDSNPDFATLHLEVAYLLIRRIVDGSHQIRDALDLNELPYDQGADVRGLILAMTAYFFFYGRLPIDREITFEEGGIMYTPEIMVACLYDDWMCNNKKYTNLWELLSIISPPTLRSPPELPALGKQGLREEFIEGKEYTLTKFPEIP